MHLPDPNYVSFVTAVITSVTAAIGLGKLILEKKNAELDRAAFLKNSLRFEAALQKKLIA
jgi:hypothetical protein